MHTWKNNKHFEFRALCFSARMEKKRNLKWRRCLHKIRLFAVFLSLSLPSSTAHSSADENIFDAHNKKHFIKTDSRSEIVAEKNASHYNWCVCPIIIGSRPINSDIYKYLRENCSKLFHDNYLSFETKAIPLHASWIPWIVAQGERIHGRQIKTCWMNSCVNFHCPIIA